MARVGTRGAGLSKAIALSVKNKLTHLGANVSDDLARLSGKVEDAFAYADGAVSKNIGKHNARVYQSNGGNWDEVASGILGGSGVGRKAASEFSDDASQALAKHGDEVSQALRETGEQAGKHASAEFGGEASQALAKHGDEVNQALKETGEQSGKRASAEFGEDELSASKFNIEDIPDIKPRFGERKISGKEYETLRHSTPTKDIRDKVNDGVILPIDDFAIPGRQIVSRLEADHIVAMDKITRMDGFEHLTFAEKKLVLNFEENFIGLSKSANASKGSKTYEEWKIYKRDNIPIESKFRKEMIEKEKILECKIQGLIDFLNNRRK